ncbi:MAG: mechanosensitive ion channel, partial [Fibrobacter sp.]|nr:mechanosensitive ion channel [Fibrobacter sp.]
MIELIQSWLLTLKISPHYSTLISKIIVSFLILLLSVIAYYVVKRVVLKTIQKSAKLTKNKIDDLLLEHNVFNTAVLFVPLIILFYAIPGVFNENLTLSAIFIRIIYILMVISATLVINNVINALHEIYNALKISRDIPVKGFVQVLKIILFFSSGLIVIALVIQKTPLYLLSGLGAMTAVILLIFKDPLLGLVAGIQLTANKMLRHGDWIEMPKYGADGDVEDITLTTIKVRNWDKTIVTIPTYALISESFKNWRGMRESGGRRIKRAIYIDINSVKFCNSEMLDRFGKIQYIKEYLEKKNAEVIEHNKTCGIDDSCPVNGRRLTNVGTFRAYLEQYLRNHPSINHSMICMVRQLEPGNNGLPLEI